MIMKSDAKSLANSTVVCAKEIQPVFGRVALVCASAKLNNRLLYATKQRSQSMQQ